MNINLSQKENPDSDTNDNNKKTDYEYLLIRLKDIKESISYLEENFLFK